MCIIYLHTKFHMSNSSGSLVIAIKPKTKHIFDATFILLSEILQKYEYINKSCVFFQICYHANVRIHIKCR
jgi:hypothetical protein